MISPAGLAWAREQARLEAERDAYRRPVVGGLDGAVYPSDDEARASRDAVRCAQETLGPVPPVTLRWIEGLEHAGAGFL